MATLIDRLVSYVGKNARPHQQGQQYSIQAFSRKKSATSRVLGSISIFPRYDFGEGIKVAVLHIRLEGSLYVEVWIIFGEPDTARLALFGSQYRLRVGVRRREYGDSQRSGQEFFHISWNIACCRLCTSTFARQFPFHLIFSSYTASPAASCILVSPAASKVPFDNLLTTLKSVASIETLVTLCPFALIAATVVLS